MLKNPVVAFLGIVFAGIIGMLIDSYVGLDGNFSVVVALGIVGAILVTKEK